MSKLSYHTIQQFSSYLSRKHMSTQQLVHNHSWHSIISRNLGKPKCSSMPEQKKKCSISYNGIVVICNEEQKSADVCRWAREVGSIDNNKCLRIMSPHLLGEMQQGGPRHHGRLWRKTLTWLRSLGAGFPLGRSYREAWTHSLKWRVSEPGIHLLISLGWNAQKWCLLSFSFFVFFQDKSVLAARGLLMGIGFLCRVMKLENTGCCIPIHILYLIILKGLIFC